MFRINGYKDSQFVSLLVAFMVLATRSDNPRQLILIDFGATHLYSPEFCALYSETIDGASQQNRQVAIRATQQLGFLNGRETNESLDPHCEALFAVARPFAHDQQFDFGTQDMTRVVYKEMPQMMKKRLQSPPHEVYSLHRKLSGAYLVCIKLGARVNCRGILDEVIERARRVDTEERFELASRYLGSEYVERVRARDQEIILRKRQFG